MIRPTALPKTLRTGAAAASVLGVFALAGCATTDAAAPENQAGAAATGAGYADGTYSADGTYVDGGGVSETVNVTLTLADDVVTDVEVTGDAASPQSQQYQQAFIGGIAAEVEGKNIDDLSVSKVAGSSLTSGGFNQALEEIKADAAA